MSNSRRRLERRPHTLRTSGNDHHDALWGDDMSARRGWTIRYRGHGYVRITKPGQPTRFGGRWKPFQVSLRWVIISWL